MNAPLWTWSPDTWWTLFVHFLSLSLMAIGGAITLVPDMHRRLVEGDHLLTDADFTGSIALAPFILFAIVFFWTPPHTWALAMRYKEDYKAAGVPMLPVIATEEHVTRQILIYTWLTVICSFLLIGFWHSGRNSEAPGKDLRDASTSEGRANSNAARKAFIMNRIGDRGMVMAMFTFLAQLGTLNFAEVSAKAPTLSGGYATLLGFLDFLRATIEWKTADLDTAALHRRLPGHPSAMTLGGLLKHLAFVEFWWFEAVALGEPTSAPWVGADFDADPDWDWHSAAQDSAADLRALWQGQVERSRQIVVDLLAADGDDGAAALARAHRIREGRDPVSLRWILTHMIEEYGRHAGHADLLREGIDGQAGE